MFIMFPPIIDSAMPPVLLNSEGKFNPVSISYTDPVGTSEYNYLRAKVVMADSNKSIVNTESWRNNFIYQKLDSKSNSKFFSLKMEDLKNDNLEGKLIKIQLSYVKAEEDFDETHNNAPTEYQVKTREELLTLSDDLKEFGIIYKIVEENTYVTWAINDKEEYYLSTIYEGDIAYFDWVKKTTNSEWSTVLVLKFIKKENEVEIGTPDNFSLTPLFQGTYSFTENSKELKDRYCFELYKNGLLLETSGWLQGNVSNQEAHQYRFKTGLKDLEEYQVTYKSYTVNNYYVETQIDYIPVEGTSKPIEDLSFSLNPCYEDGCIDLYISTQNNLTGNFIVTRCSEKDGFSKWEDLYAFSLLDSTENNKLIYTDFTIESGVEYKYAIQQLYGSGLRSARLTDKENETISLYLPYAFLTAGNIQLKLKYNNKVNSYKHTVQATKQDGLGSKYPMILRNGYTYYAEFPVTGLITLHLDEGGRFFVEKEDGYYYKDELVIPASTYAENFYDVNLTDSNFYIERIFREKVEEFLNDGGYKLYRSPAEGNHIVSLMNVSLTPNQQLGRMISEFTSTAYEVMDYDIEKMQNIGLIESNIAERTYTTKIAGQIYLPPNTDLLEAIKQTLPVHMTLNEVLQAELTLSPKGDNFIQPTSTGSVDINNSKYYIANSYTYLNKITSLFYEQQGFLLEVEYKAIVEADLQAQADISSIKHQERFAGQIQCDLTNPTIDIINKIKSDAQEKNKTYLKMLSLEFEGDGIAQLNGSEVYFNELGLKISNAQELEEISMTTNTGTSYCNYVALVEVEG